MTRRRSAPTTRRSPRDLNNLGMVARDQGDYPGACAYLERALDIFERALPPTHPYIASLRENLAALPDGE